MTDIAIRWAGSSDATSGSTYRVERTLNNVDWLTLAASQAATAPYASPSNELAADTSHGDATISLVNAAAFATSGWLWLDDALVEWTGKAGNDLTGCVWHSGYGVYASGSTVYVAHESYADLDVTISNNAVLYRITHISANGQSSAPAHVWYYDPPVPQDSGICVVVVNIGSDLGAVQQASVAVQASLEADTQFGLLAGQHLDANAGGNQATTNAFGLAFFHCWRDRVRSGIAGVSDAGYVFILKPGAGQLVVTAESIPDRDWVLLTQIATQVSTTVGA